MTANHRLGRRAQANIGDLSLGIVATSPDPADPAARMRITDRASGNFVTPVVRPGDRVSIGGHVVVFTEIVPGSRDGYVRFTVQAGDVSPGNPEGAQDA
jgi:hypothetical protein